MASAISQYRPTTRSESCRCSGLTGPLLFRGAWAWLVPGAKAAAPWSRWYSRLVAARPRRRSGAAYYATAARQSWPGCDPPPLAAVATGVCGRGFTTEPCIGRLIAYLTCRSAARSTRELASARSRCRNTVGAQFVAAVRGCRGAAATSGPRRDPDNDYAREPTELLARTPSRYSGHNSSGLGPTADRRWWCTWGTETADPPVLCRARRRNDRNGSASQRATGRGRSVCTGLRAP